MLDESRVEFCMIATDMGMHMSADADRLLSRCMYGCTSLVRVTHYKTLGN